MNTRESIVVSVHKNFKCPRLASRWNRNTVLLEDLDYVDKCEAWLLSEGYARARIAVGRGARTRETGMGGLRAQRTGC